MSNPVLSRNQWASISTSEGRGAVSTMSIPGTIMKTMILAVITLGVIGLTWNQIRSSENGTLFGIAPQVAMFGSAIAALVLLIIMRFAPRATPLLGMGFAALEGVFLGVFTLFVAGIAPEFASLPLVAAGLTGCTLLGMLMLYMTGIIRATPLFVKMVSGAIVGLVLGMVGLWVMSMFFPWAADVRGALYGNGLIGIGFSVFVVGLAAFTLVLDFDFIEKGSKSGQPKYMEWVGAVGLLVTLVWLYIEILILLMKLQSRD